MSFKGPAVFRTVRQIALEKGTASSGFEDVLRPDLEAGEYYDTAEAAHTPDSAVQPEPNAQPKPYKL